MYIYSMSFTRLFSREAITDMASTSSSSFFGRKICKLLT